MNMEERIERAALCFLLLTPIILGVSEVLAILGIWSWILAAVYALNCVGLALTLFHGYAWKKKLLLFGAMEGFQILSCAVILGLRAMF